MRIAINTRFWISHKLEGIGWYTHHIVSRMIRSHPEDEFYLLFDRPPSEDLKFPTNCQVIVLPPPARHPILWYLWMEVSVLRALKKIKPDVFFSPDGFLNLRTTLPQVPVIHDINFVHHPEFVNPGARRYYRRFFPQFARKATEILTVSEYSRQDIAETWNIPIDRITVTYNSSQRPFSPMPESMNQERRMEVSDGHPYYLFVGAFNPRKNLQRIFEAFDRFAAIEEDHRLVLVGEKMYWPREIDKAFQRMKYQDRVIFTGRLEGDELNSTYSAATALVFPSINEGFGIPIVEAFQSGIPVITSTTTSLPEVAGKGGILVDPKNVDQIYEAMIQLSGDRALRDELAEAGKRELERFDWDKSAQIAYEVLKKAARKDG